MDEMMLCPKSRDLVNSEQCVAIRHLPKVMAEYFSSKVCKTVVGCPKEDYCTVFECGWTSVGSLLQTTLKE